VCAYIHLHNIQVTAQSRHVELSPPHTPHTHSNPPPPGVNNGRINQFEFVSWAARHNPDTKSHPPGTRRTRPCVPPPVASARPGEYSPGTSRKRSVFVALPRVGRVQPLSLSLSLIAERQGHVKSQSAAQTRSQPPRSWAASPATRPRLPRADTPRSRTPCRGGACHVPGDIPSSWGNVHKFVTLPPRQCNAKARQETVGPEELQSGELEC
jgi:hypothetical protein